MKLVPFEMLPKSMQNYVVGGYYALLKKRLPQLILKRIFDIFFSILLLFFSLPIMAAIAITISLTSRGSPVFRQKRVTQWGNIFTIYKFRTMETSSGNPTLLQGKVTRVGSFLRRTRLDELPQLINIMRGEMSFVGARPEIPEFVKSYSSEMMATLLLPAGVTSRASIVYKNEENLLPVHNREEFYIRHILPPKMQYNLEYMKDFSLWEDIKIMLSTGVAILRR